MRIVCQRVNSATLSVNNKLISHINNGIVVFCGFKEGDNSETIDYFVRKISGLRIFEDNNNKMNLTPKDVGAEFLIIPNFTLYADCAHGFRPCFIYALEPAKAKPLFEEFVQKMKTNNEVVGSGIFGADMQIQQSNDGPITLFMEK